MREAFNYPNGSPPLPYYEPFNYADGAAWPFWQVPGARAMIGGSNDVGNKRGRIKLNGYWEGGYPQWSARLPIEDAPEFDLTMTLGMEEIAPTWGGYPDDRSGYYYIYFAVELGDVQYELAFDADWEVDEGSTTPKLRPTIYSLAANPAKAVPFVVDKTQPVFVRIQESGTDRRLKVWQGVEPSAWTITATAAVHSGPRNIDLSALSQASGGEHYLYVDDIRAGATLADVSNTGNGGNVVSLPYYEPFNYKDGAKWPDQWAITSSVGDVQGRSGRALLAGDDFHARLNTDDAAVYDLTFQFFLGTVPQHLTGSVWLRVQLEDGVDAVYYEIHADRQVGVEAAIKPGPYLSMNNLTSDSISVRIQETGHNRSFKIWQGSEPDGWTLQANAVPLHAGPRYIDFTIHAELDGPADAYLDEIAVSTNPVAWVNAGSTQHFVFYHDPDLGAKGATDVQAAMVHAEEDLLNHFHWFGSTAPWSNGPAKVYVKFVTAAHSKYPGFGAFYDGTGTIYVNWADSPDHQIDIGYRGMLVHEVVHHFQNLQGEGHWDDSASMRESHATFLDREFRRAQQDWSSLKTGGYADQVGPWLNSDRFPDDANDDYGSDDFNNAVGYTMLFFNWIRWEKGHSAASITQANANTAPGAYQVLTHSVIDPFPAWLKETDSAFPRGTRVDMSQYLDIANPYPLKSGARPASAQPNQGGAVTTSNKAWLLQQMKQMRGH